MMTTLLRCQLHSRPHGSNKGCCRYKGTRKITHNIAINNSKNATNELTLTRNAPSGSVSIRGRILLGTFHSAKMGWKAGGQHPIFYVRVESRKQIVFSFISLIGSRRPGRVKQNQKATTKKANGGDGDEGDEDCVVCSKFKPQIDHMFLNDMQYTVVHTKF